MGAAGKILIAVLLLVSGLARAFDHGTWDTLLQDHVKWRRDGVASVVDYDGFAGDRQTLNAYLDRLSAVDAERFDGFGRDEKLAFLINAYNAFTVALILRQDPRPASIRDIGSIFRGPWSQRFFTLLGEERSLDEVEHEMIRGNPALMDARIHFAVNCASVGCPALRPQAYTGGRLEEQLEDSTRRFLADRQRNRYRDGTLWVSPLFDWYEQDFDAGGGVGVGAWLARYHQALGLNDQARGALARDAIRVRFTDYDWSLNDHVN